MQAPGNAIEQGLDQFGALIPDLIAAGLVLLLSLAAGHAAGRALDQFTDDRKESLPTARLTKRLVRWVAISIGFVLALQILGLTAVVTSLLATGGLAAVVLGFAFREIGENLLAGLVLVLSRSFEIGDLIESSGFTGEVKAIDLRHVHVRTADGLDVFVPSASILRNPLVNYTRDGLRRGDFVIGIDYGERPDLAIEATLEAVRSVPGVLTDPAPGARLEAFEAQYLTEAAKPR